MGCACAEYPLCNNRHARNLFYRYRYHVSTFWVILLTVVGILVWLASSQVLTRNGHQWRGIRNTIPHTRAHRQRVARALRRGTFTIDDPVVRALMLERARYLDGYGARDLAIFVLYFLGFALGLSWAYLSPPLRPYVIGLQSLIFLFTLDSAIANIHRIKNARRFLAPWWTAG